MNIDETKALLAVMYAAWPSQRARMTKDDVRAQLVIWSAALEDVDYRAAEVAMTRIAKAERWMPSIADVRAEIGVLAHGVQRAGGEAWGEVNRAMGKYGWNRAPGVDFTFEDPITVRVVKAMGWRSMCESDNTDHIRARFIDSYNDIAKTERREARTMPGAVSPKLAAPSPVLALEGQKTVAQLTAKYATVECNCDNEERDPELDIHRETCPRFYIVRSVK